MLTLKVKSKSDWKKFIPKVNEVVQKMSGSDRPVPVWYEFGEEIEEHSTSKPVKYSRFV
jgi:hypothetical protein